MYMNHFQISTIENCKMTRQGDLPFNFTDGSCNTFDPIKSHPSKIFLCFGSNDPDFGGLGSIEYGCYYKDAFDV